MREYIDAAAFKEMILCANAALHRNIQPINELNVFPVPDGDTGTNMGLTMDNAAAELKKKDFSTVAVTLASASSSKKRATFESFFSACSLKESRGVHFLPVMLIFITTSS